MTVVGMAVGNAILAWAAVVVALIGALAAVVLLFRVVQPALEIERYVDDIWKAADEITANVEGVGELVHTRELAISVPERASAYARRVGGHSAI